MPDGTIHNHGLAFDNTCCHSRSRLFGGDLNRHGLAQYARLTTDGDHFVATDSLHEHVAHHAQNPFRGLDDRESQVTPTTGQMDTSVLERNSESKRVRSLSDLSRSMLSIVVRQGQCRKGSPAPIAIFLSLFDGQR